MCSHTGKTSRKKPINMKKGTRFQKGITIIIVIITTIKEKHLKVRYKKSFCSPVRKQTEESAA